MTIAVVAAAVLVFWATPAPADAQRARRGGKHAGGTEQNQSPPPQETAASVADQAIRKLVAWKHKQARTYLESKREAFGDAPAFKMAWGLLRAEEAKLDEALTSLTAAAQGASSDAAPAFYRGEVLYWKKAYNDAKAAWKNALDRATALVEANPNSARARYYLGAALIRNMKFADARAPLNKALEKGFDRAMVKYQIGLSFVFEKNWQAAKEAFDAVIEADATFAHAYYYRGRALDELGRTNEMLVDMDRFLNLAPDAREADIARSLLGR
jgi:tetratricopeptide (TPR) repeat protein